MKITNVSPYGDLYVELLHRAVDAGATVDVSDDQAQRLLLQTENWKPADDEATGALADLVAQATAADAADQQAARDRGEFVIPSAAGTSEVDGAPASTGDAAQPAPAADPDGTTTVADDGTRPMLPPASVDSVPPAQVADAPDATPTVPNQSAAKADWQNFAQQSGVDPTGMTKQQLIDATTSTASTSSDTAQTTGTDSDTGSAGQDTDTSGDANSASAASGDNAQDPAQSTGTSDTAASTASADQQSADTGGQS